MACYSDFEDVSRRKFMRCVAALVSPPRAHCNDMHSPALRLAPTWLRIVVMSHTVVDQRWPTCDHSAVKVKSKREQSEANQDQVRLSETQ